MRVNVALRHKGSTSGAPQPAANVGYNKRTYGPNLIMGTNWFPFDFFSNTSAGSVTTSGNGVILAGGGSNTYNAQIATATQAGAGQTFGGGGYFEATISFTGSSIAHDPSQWPSFWSNDEHMGDPNPPYTTQWYEPDFMEMDAANALQYGIAIHNWTSTSGGGQQNSATLPIVNVPTGTDFSQPQKYGFLWVQATSTAVGYAQYYFNRAVVGTVTWAQGDSRYGAFDSRHITLILGTGPTNPMTVYSVEVWQANGSSDIPTIP